MGQNKFIYFMREKLLEHFSLTNQQFNLNTQKDHNNYVSKWT